MKRPFDTMLLLLLALLLSACAGDESALQPGLDLEERIREYESAVNEGDPDRLLSLMTGDARWRLPTRKEPLERAMIQQSLVMDSALGVQLDIHDCEIDGLVANCSATERNDWLSLHGLDTWNQPTMRFVFDDAGLIRLVSWIGRDKETYAELKLVWAAFEEWAKADPEREQRFYSMINREEKRLHWDPPTAETLMKLGREWVDAGRPGLEEMRAARAAEKKPDRDREDASLE